MKIARVSIIAILLSSGAIAHAESINGKIERENGRFVISSDGEKTAIKAINTRYFENYVGAKARIEGSLKGGTIDADVITVLTQRGEKVVYDWNSINDDLYEN